MKLELRYILSCLLACCCLFVHAGDWADALHADTISSNHSSSLTPYSPSPTPHSYIAFGTNLLFDAATLPNLELEATMGDHWSALLEWTSPWWLNEKKQNCLEMICAGVESRYWFHSVDRQSGSWIPLHGHFVGLYGNVGYFDIEHDGEGYQDDFAWITGVSYGYAFRLNRQLRLECSIGIGYLRCVDYNHYKQQVVNGSEYLVTEERGNFSWVGPTKAKVSLIWIPKLMKKGDRR